jgi:hypothetical protein
MTIEKRLAREPQILPQKRPATTARMKEEEAQTATMLSLAVQSRSDVRCIAAPFPYRG